MTATTATETPAPRPSLGQLAIRGGGYLVGREALGMILRLVGVVLVVREIGPGAYGLYSGAAAFVMFAVSFAQSGLEVYLVRLPGEVGRRQYNQAFTLLLVVSIVVTGLAEALSFALGGVLRPVGVLPPLRILLLSIPVNVLWAPAQASIERGFRYRAMGLLELGGDVVLYATAIPLAFLGKGEWALVAGFFAWQTWLFIGSWVVSGLRFRLDWSITAVRDMARHGVTYSSAYWAGRLADLVNPLVVGTFLGATGVGYVAFAQRLVETIAFAKRGAYRLGMVAMSRLGDDELARQRYSVEEGMLLQLLTVAVPFACFGVVARWAVPAIFGHEWARAVPLYSLLALASVLSAVQFIQTTFLFSRGRNIAVSAVAIVQSLCIALGAVFLVRRFGLDGFGEAWLVGLLALFVCDRIVRRMFTFSYRRIVPWVLVLGPPVLFPLLAPPWGLLLFVPLGGIAAPPMRAEVVRIVGFVRSALAGRTRATATDAALVGAGPRQPALGPDDHGLGGVGRLLSMVKAESRAAVAFAAVRRADGHFASVAIPATVPGTPWSPDALDSLVRQGWAQAGGGGGGFQWPASVPGHGGEPRLVGAGAAPLADPGEPGAPWGLLGVAGVSSGHLVQRELDLLGHLAGRLTAFLRARDRLADPAVLEARPPEPAVAANPLASELDVLLGPDPLTGLATLTALVGRLSTSLAHLRDQPGSVGLILIEVTEPDGWRLPSSTALLDVACRLTRHLRERDLIARIGPSTFALLVDLLPGPIDVDAIRDRAIASLGGGIAAGGGELKTRSGIACATTGTALGAEHLLRVAAAQMRAASSQVVPPAARSGFVPGTSR